MPPKGTTTQKIEFTVPEYGFYTLNATLKIPMARLRHRQTDTRFSVLNGRADGKRNEKWVCRTISDINTATQR